VGLPVIIVKETESNVVIVIPPGASESGDEHAAAKELQNYLYRVSKARIQIKYENEIIDTGPIPRSKIPIYVGKCKASRHLNKQLYGMVNDGYVIEIDSDSIHLIGKNELATRFAVYGFLEDYIGVHWFLPEIFGEEFPKNMGTHIPQKETIILKATLDVQEPSFKYRMIGKPDKPWTVRNKMNFVDDNENGFQINRACHSFTTDFIDPEEYSGHPEYFATVDGDRMTSSEILRASKKQRSRMKLNVGNPEVRDTLIREVQNYIFENPTIDIINLFPGDGRRFDESEESRRLDGENYEGYTVADVNREGRKLGEEFGRVLSKRYTMFYHDVLAGLVDDHDTTFMTAAYSAYQYAPLEVADPDFVSQYRMDDRVMLLITHSWEHNHPIGERNTQANDNFAESIDGWSNLYSNFGVYEFYRKLAMNELPFPIIHSLRHDIPYYHNNNFDFFFTQYSINDVGTYGLNYYIAAKLLWNIYADVDELLAEFYSEFYGRAGIHMRNYYETLENTAIASDLELSPKYYGAFLDLFTDQVLEDCSNHLENAKAAVMGDELLLARVELSKVSLDYTVKVIDYLKEIRGAMTNKPYWKIQAWRDLDLETAEDKADEIRETITRSADYKTITHSNYTNRLLNVGGPTVGGVRKYFYGDGDQYTKEKWLEMRDVSVEPGYRGHELFDIWIFANDIDYRSGDGEEHQINLVNRDGSTTELGRIAQNNTEAGNRLDKGFLLQHFSFDEYVGRDDRITIEVHNFPGGPRNSKFYGIAIMPHMDTTSQDAVTNYYQDDIEFIRENSIGFTEFGSGMQNPDGDRLNITVKLFVEIP